MMQQASRFTTTPQADDVRGQLKRILADPLFQRSQRLSAFLRFIVEGTLAGRCEEIKESILGTEVFGRGASYDPHADPVVRIMAGRLRGKLAEYYQSSGQADRVVITLPRGGYIPRAAWRSEALDHRLAAKPSSSRLVGRGTEMYKLRSAFASAEAGSGIVVMISGEAGAGKTALVEEFLSDLAASGVQAFVAAGNCSERLAESEAFVPITESLADLLHREPESDIARRMKLISPGWHMQLAPGAEDAQSPGTRPASPERMRREFLSLFEALSRERPAVLFLDDVHWADPSTCDLVAWVGARLNRTRLLVIMAYRPAELPSGEPTLARLRLSLERRGLCQEIPVSSLTPEDVASYISMEFPGNAFPEELPRIVHQRTEGNALFMAETLRYLRDQRFLVEVDGAWKCVRPSEIAQVIPVGIRSMIRLKVQQVAEPDRMLLIAAAVQGLHFDSAVVARVLSRDPAEVEERLQALELGHEFVQAVSERSFSDNTLSVRYRFFHVFYQHALYESLAPSRRAALSLETARTLAELAGEGASAIASDLALLFETGRDPKSASEFFLHAARHAARMFAYAEAATLCDRGLKALTALPESVERTKQELRFSLIHGLALMMTRGFAAAEVERAYSRSRELCIRMDEKPRLIPVLWGLHTCYVNRSDLASSLAVAEEMVQAAGYSGEPLAKVEALHALGTTLVFMGRLQEGREALERIFETYPVSQHVPPASIYVMDPCVTSLSLLARVLAYSGFLDQALEKAQSSIELAQLLAHPPSLTYAMLWRGYIRHTRGENAQCCDDLELTMTMSREHELPLFLEWARIVRGSALCRMGRVEEGIAEMRHSVDRQIAMGSLLDRPYCLTLLAEALAGSRALNEALKLCEEALEFTNRTGFRSYEPETHRIKGEALLATGDDSLLPDVSKEFASGLQLARASGSGLLELRAAISYFRLHRKLGDLSRARTLLGGVVSQFTEGQQTPVLTEAACLAES